MKLDYLQFLELERFTRFGARLEPEMQQAIKRGQILREILKQERVITSYSIHYTKLYEPAASRAPGARRSG